MLHDVRPPTPAVAQALLKALDDSDRNVAKAAANAINSVEGPTLAPQAVTHLIQGLKSADPAICALIDRRPRACNVHYEITAL